MDFPITGLMDEGACYAILVKWLYPAGSPARAAIRATAWPSTATDAPQS